MNYNYTEEFIESCKKGDVKNILQLLKRDDVDVNSENEYAFRWACAYGHVEVVKILLDLTGKRKINVHAKSEHAFRFACWNGHIEFMEILLSLKDDREIDIDKSGVLLKKFLHLDTLNLILDRI